MDIDSKSGHIEGANQIADILENASNQLAGRSPNETVKAVGGLSSQQTRPIKHTMTLFYPFIRTRSEQLETPPNIL